MKTELLLFCSTDYINMNNSIIDDGFKIFDDVKFLNEHDLDAEITSVINKIIKKYGRLGFGYWIWKAYIILQELNNMDENDILVFLDMHCMLNNLKKHMNDIVTILQNQPVIFAYTGLPEKLYTTMKLRKYIEKYINYTFTDEDWDGSQYEGGEVFLRNCEESRKFIKLWYDIMLSNVALITNIYDNLESNDKNFVSNRNDQSVASLLYKSKKYKTPNYLTWLFLHS